jgi:hypothetical protein
MSADAETAIDVGEDAVYVVDDLLRDAHALRELALAADYPQNRSPTTYAGRFSARDYPIAGLDAYIGRLTGHDVVPAPSPGGHGRFRLCLDGEVGTGGVHIDNCHWTGVYYLTLDEHARGGTSFFRHRPSNTLRAPVYPEDWAAWNVESASQLWKDVIVPHTNDPTQWELTRHVEMKFNRLVLFRPWLWHMADDGFGDRVANGRLIYLLVYNQA